jgi:phage minor structural protein
MMSRPLVWLYGLDGARLLPLHDLALLEIEDRLNELETLRFTIRADDPKAPFLKADQLCEYQDRLYRIEEIEELREGRIALVKVYAEAAWMDLGKRVRPDVFTVLAQTVEQGLTSILAGSGWTVGTTPPIGTLFSMEDIDATVLQLVRRWAQISGFEILWDTVNRTVSFVTALGQDRGIGFRWGYNLLSVERRLRPPIATRLYAYGANALDIVSVNPLGEEFVEDYSFYTAQGLTLAQARDLYRKDQIFVDTAFISAVNLYDAALRRIAQLAQPLIAYELKVAELSRLTSSPADDVAIGDIVRVRDRDFNLDLTTRVVRLVRDELEPQRNEVELDYLEPGLGALEQDAGTGRSIDYGQLTILSDANVFATTIGTSTNIWASIQITVTGNSIVVLGGTFLGQAAGSGTVRFQATIDGAPIGGNYEIDFVDGEIVEFSWPTWQDVAEGSFIVDWRARVIDGIGSISVLPQQARGWLLARGAIGVALGSNPNRFIVEEVGRVVVAQIGELSAEFTVEIVTPPPIEPLIEETIPQITDIEELSVEVIVDIEEPFLIEVDDTVDTVGAEELSDDLEVDIQTA